VVGRADYRVAMAVLFHEFVPAFRIAFVVSATAASASS
jgi:hypothetical protein